MDFNQTKRTTYQHIHDIHDSTTLSRIRPIQMLLASNYDLITNTTTNRPRDRKFHIHLILTFVCDFTLKNIPLL